MILLGAGTPAAYEDLQLREPEADLARGGLGRIRAVDEIERHLGAELTSDRTRVGLDRIGRSDHLARGLHGARPLENHRDELASGDELDQLAEKRLVLVLLVVDVGDLLVGLHQLERDEPKPLPLEPRNDLAGERTLEGIGLDEDECALGGHGRGTVPESLRLASRRAKTSGGLTAGAGGALRWPGADCWAVLAAGRAVGGRGRGG